MSVNIYEMNVGKVILPREDRVPRTSLVEHCPHVGNLRLDGNKTLLAPAHWSCTRCGTTESVWACLLCSNVACGREAGKHALEHFKSSNHPIAIEINKKYVHCYFCDAYVFNDNSHNEIQLIRDTLNQLATQTFGEARTRSGRILRQASVNFAKDENRTTEQSSEKADKLYTAQCHHRVFLLTRIFTAWQCYIREAKTQSPTVPDTPTLMSPPAFPPTKVVKKRLAAGVTGLRNLGNTCYMNSALQALSHQTLFRECFRLLNVQQVLQPISSSGRCCMRQTTMECFDEVTRPIRRQSKGITRTRLHGLSGGKGGTAEGGCCGEEGVDSTNQEASLCKSLHAIFRVMWSGKWAMVTPHAVLSAVWSKIPDFRGYSQQDTHEFLCELLSELQSELNEFPDSVAVIFSEPMRSVIVPSEIISSSFEGQLRSEVVCNTCNTVSEMIEPFYDISLDFPPRYQTQCNSKAPANSASSCELSELLDHYTMRETLEGCIYSCSFCNNATQGESLEFQSATKQLSLHKPPDVLRLHLKRFRWHETDRAKINIHVSFPTTLDITPFCNLHVDTNKSHLSYDLTSVIMHHGKGFASGHYTAYCYNTEALSWVHCNDRRVSLCTEDEVLNSQAYILFYRRLSSLAAIVQPTCSASSPTVDDVNPRKRVRLW